MPESISKSAATRFIIFLGTVSLFADIAYEGARSVIGPYFNTLGASAAVVGLVSGGGELASFSLRLLTGYLADRTRAYWALTIIGYGVNMLAVPLLGFAGNWGVAATLVVAERTGKSIRSPARDVMLSQAAHTVGRGWGFGLHAAMDQIGAVTGPLLVAFMLARTHSFPVAFRILAIPAALAMAALLLARAAYPHPHDLEPAGKPLTARGYPREFWLYVGGAGLVAAGFADFPLIAYHVEKHAIAPAAWIPVIYAGAMLVNGLLAPVFGKLYDRFGVAALAGGLLLPAAGLPCAFSSSLPLVLTGTFLWGAGMGVMDGTLRAGIASMIPRDQRGAAYGVYNAGIGLSWFAGSAIMGKLYDVSIPALLVFGVTAQIGASAAFLFHRSLTKRLTP